MNGTDTHTHTYTLWVPDAPANIHHFGCKAQKVENPVLLSGLNLLNKARSSFELHSMSFLNIVFVHNTHEIFFSWKLLRATIILIKCLYKLMVSLFTTSFPFLFLVMLATNLFHSNVFQLFSLNNLTIEILRMDQAVGAKVKSWVMVYLLQVFCLWLVSLVYQIPLPFSNISRLIQLPLWSI